MAPISPHKDLPRSFKPQGRPKHSSQVHHLLSTPIQTLIKLKSIAWTSKASATSIEQANSQCTSQIGHSTLQGAQDFQISPRWKLLLPMSTSRTTMASNHPSWSTKTQKQPNWLSTAPQGSQGHKSALLGSQCPQIGLTHSQGHKSALLGSHCPQICLTHSQKHKSDLLGSQCPQIGLTHSQGHKSALNGSQCPLVCLTHSQGHKSALNGWQTPQATQRCLQGSQKTLTRLQLAQSQSTMHPSAQSALMGSQCTLLSTNSK
jgi:hypothetical protein